MTFDKCHTVSTIKKLQLLGIQSLVMNPLDVIEQSFLGVSLAQIEPALIKLDLAYQAFLDSLEQVD